ncbi:hypothetical protein C8R44DRAFT_992658 [Mycena epipterygia]|nr:hypothetical protein C8R44DRAFT_992658 [Mycena epipterygia]
MSCSARTWDMRLAFRHLAKHAMAREHEHEDTDMAAIELCIRLQERATVKPQNISPRSTSDLVLALASDAVSRPTYPRPPDSENGTSEREGARSPCSPSTRRHTRRRGASMRTAACAFSPRRTALPVLRASYDTAHTALRASYVARVRSRHRRSSTPSTSTPRLAARDGAQPHSDVDTPLPRVAARPHRAPPGTATGAPSLHPYACCKYHVRGPILDAENTGPFSPRTQRTHRRTSTPMWTLSTRDHTPVLASPLAMPYLRVHRARWLPTVDSAYVNAPGHAADLRARVPAHNAARQYRHPASSRRGRPYDSPPHHTRSPRAPQLASLYLCARQLPGASSSRSGRLLARVRLPFHNLPLDPTHAPRISAPHPASLYLCAPSAYDGTRISPQLS